LSLAEQQTHIQEMVMEGITNQEIVRLHPELTVEDIVSAMAVAARTN